jgi:phage terminase small subunit
MGRKAMPIDLMLIKGKKNLTKQEIEERKSTEEALKPRAEKIEAPEWLQT